MRRRYKILILTLCIATVGAATIYGLSTHKRVVTSPKTSSSFRSTTSKSTASNQSIQTTQSNFDKSRYSTSDPSSIWVVVNKQHSLLPKTFSPSDLVNVGSGQYLRTEAAAALGEMIADGKKAGYTLTPASAYRSYSTQVSVYSNEVASYGQARADSESARPGYSEHQTGLAVDIAGGGCSIDDCFGTTPEGKWAAANANKYGFILRYTASNTSVTGYRAEAWHFRYVGRYLAGEMQARQVTTLEEFFGISGGSTYQ